MPNEELATSIATQKGLMVVIVFYGMRPEDSVAFKTLQSAMALSDYETFRTVILLYDNTPGGCDMGELPDGVRYHASNDNAGLASAYNRGLEIAEAEGLDWLLTLDQDTSLPDYFLLALREIVNRVASDEAVAAIVPQISDNGRALSPSWWLWDSIPKRSPLGLVGITKRNASAFNSASTLRVSSIREIGGYDPRFWLDYADIYLYWKISRGGLHIYVAGNIHVEHQLSVLDMNRRVSVSRYKNILSAGCAFRDLEMGWLAGLDYTLRLMYRIFYKHWRYGHTPAFRRASLQMLRKRLFQSRKRRIEDWKRESESRIS